MISNVIAQRGAKTASNGNLREAVSKKLYADDRTFRADRLIEGWQKVPEIGVGLDTLPVEQARNTAINLDTQAKFMYKMTEAQLSVATDGQKPENMLRLVRLAMPSAIRNQVFTEFAMETAKDSIKYFRPTVTKNQKGTNNMSAHNSNGDYDNSRSKDPWGMEDGADFNGDSYQKSLYEMSEDRFVQEVANAVIISGADAAAAGDYLVGGKKVSIAANANAKYTIVFGKKATDENPSEFDMGYIDGYVTVFGTDETDTIAQQHKNTKKFFINSTDYDGVEIVAAKDAKDNEILGVFQVLDPNSKIKALKAYGRYDSEADFEGDNLGEIQMRMSTYDFEPRPISIGITFSKLAEITLDASFGVSLEDEMLTYAAQEIKASMDRQAFRLAYHAAKTNPKNYTVTFDAGWDKTASADSNQKRGYIENAQTFQTAILKVADVQMNDIQRGGVSRMVGGPSAVSYTSLINGFKPENEVSFVGPHKFGEVNNIPIFKVQSQIIPTNEILCVWKNNESDVAIAFGTLIPFFSSGLIARKNFYTEAALATFGDYNVLNRKYLTLIRIKNLKETTEEA
jgi:hypothetical protein